MPDRISPNKVTGIISSGWNTTHECELCDKEYAGINSSLIELDNGGKRIVCNECRDKLFFKNGKPIIEHSYQPIPPLLS